ELVIANVPCEPEPARACAAWADGNPLLAIELARSLSDDERTGRRPLPSLPRPTVRAVERMQAQLDALDEPAPRALLVVAADPTGPPPPRPHGRGVEGLRANPAALDEPARRALVVVAADRTGRPSVVLGALAALGEAPGRLAEGEEAGLVSVDLN